MRRRKRLLFYQLLITKTTAEELVSENWFKRSLIRRLVQSSTDQKDRVLVTLENKLSFGKLAGVWLFLQNKHGCLEEIEFFYIIIRVIITNLSQRYLQFSNTVQHRFLSQWPFWRPPPQVFIFNWTFARISKHKQGRIFSYFQLLRQLLS